MRAGALVLTIVLVAQAAPAIAQERGHLSLGATLAGVRYGTREPGSHGTLTGVAAGGEATVRLDPFAISFGYLEGKLHPIGGEGDVTFTGGSAAVSLRLSPWLEVGSVVQVHRVDEAQPERWLFWGARAACDLPIVGHTLRGRAIYSEGVHATVNLPYGDLHSQSGEVGLTLALPGRPFVVDLATMVEGDKAAGRSRTLQQLAVTVGWRGL